MTDAPSIILERANLHYASVAFAERSLKSMVARAAGRGRVRRRVEDIHALKDVTMAPNTKDRAK